MGFFLFFFYVKFNLGANFSGSDERDLLWKPQVIFFYKEPLLFSSGRLAWGIRRWNAVKLFLKLHPKRGYSTPTAAGSEQGHISSPGFCLAPVVEGENQRGESHKRLASAPSQNAEGCLHSFPEWPAHLWGRLGSGWRKETGADQISQLWSKEWARMKKLLIKGCPER